MLLPVMNSPAMILEVMDKEPSLLQIWTLCLVVGVGGFLLSRFRYWLILIVLPVALILAWGQLSELHDPFIGPDILREAGYSYVAQSYVAMAIAVILPSVGALLRWKRSG